MAVRKGQELELDIVNLAYGGKGIAKFDGFTIFVDHAIPGDKVLTRIIILFPGRCAFPMALW